MLKDLNEPLIIELNKQREKEIGFLSTGALIPLINIPFPIIKNGSWNYDFVDMDWFSNVFSKEKRLNFLETYKKLSDIDKLSRISAIYCLCEPDKAWADIDFSNIDLSMYKRIEYF